MKTKYKYIFFKKDKESSELAESYSEKCSDVWFCLNNRTKKILGVVSYYNAWKRYCIQYREYAVFDSDCLIDIADFLKQLNDTIK